uniref:Uncharacterized protein n=1 Tax=Arundo donax TaxID=35708 RepID=A0A0A9GUR0_ARUDO
MLRWRALEQSGPEIACAVV